MLSPDALAAIRARADAATAGEWEADGATVVHSSPYRLPIPYEGGYVEDAMIDNAEAHANAAFIAASRADVVRLLDEVDSLRKMVVELEEDLANAI